jgi:hypothetical protein
MFHPRIKVFPVIDIEKQLTRKIMSIKLVSSVMDWTAK